MRNFVCLIMAAVLVTTCASSMGARASRIGIRSSSKQYQLGRTNFANHHGHGAHSISNLPVRALSTSMAFMTSPSPFARRHYEQQAMSATPQAAIQSLGGRCNFHSSTKLMMGKRKKNGGNRRKAKPDPIQKNKSKADGETIDQSLTDADLNDFLEDTDQESVPEFTATFASEYHAPVMPTECIDSMLKQGEWADMLVARQERWRKKRSILEAKRRSSGHYDDIEEEDSESGTEGDKEVEAEPSLSTSESEDSEGKHQPRLFIDGTLGGGGHSQAILQQLSPGDILISCDVDPAALATASSRLKEYLATCEYILEKSDVEEQPECEWESERPMFIPVQSNFRNLISVLSKVRHPVTGKLLLGDRKETADTSNIDAGDQLEFPRGVNGMLLDLGVSSHQIDTGERGFAFMKEGPLDMRMSGISLTSTLTAADICNEFDEATIIDLLRTYGDEPRAKRIAAAIVADRPLYTTTDLVHAINTCTPTFARQKRAGLIATSARVFQALRIVVNEEDGALKDVLEGVAPWALARCESHESGLAGSSGQVDGGILTVLSYHSMEDKMAKRVIRDGKVDLFQKRRGGALERDIYGNVIGDDDGGKSSLPFEALAKPRKATEEEVAVNSRSRSATLRVAIRI